MLSNVYLKSQQIFKDFSDFVTNSYGESWNSSACETWSWVPVQNQWVPIKKKNDSKIENAWDFMSPDSSNLKTDSKTPYYSILK